MIIQLLSSLVDLSDPEMGPRVQRQSRVRLRRPGTGVSGHESLSSSEDDESRFSPVRGSFGRGELSVEEEADLSEADKESLVEALDVREWCTAVVLESEDVLEPSEERVDTEASRSECARVYLTVVISSSSGVRKETRFSAGNMGREAAILRGIIERAGLLVSTETRLWGCLYGIVVVADSCEADVRADERVEAELGVVDVEAGPLVAFGMLLSMERRGLDGRSRAEYALEKVLMWVGETALSVSSRREAPFPKLRGWEVLTDSLGRCETGGRGNIGSEVVMSGGGAGDGGSEGGMDWEMASIMCGGTVAAVWVGAAGDYEG